QFDSIAGGRQAIFKYDLVLFVTVMGLLYVTLLVSIPKLLFRSKLLLFGLTFIITVFIMYVASWYFDRLILQPVFPASFNLPHSDLSIVNFIEKGLMIGILVGSVTGLKLFKKWINDVQLMNELREANLRTELEQLKSQVNPHFLFNTL